MALKVMPSLVALHLQAGNLFTAQSIDQSGPLLIGSDVPTIPG
jgi:hypothetical protein